MKLPRSSGLVNCTDLVKSDAHVSGKIFRTLRDVNGMFFQVPFDVVVDFSTRTLDEMKQDGGVGRAS